ncbi:MAG: histidinol dehydrogenase [Salinivirgaceae bacterium]|jgi:histidinol dehydrogenase|nr:histidinol dehydrogenase [Salinivirgaceae bacterium]
MNKFINPEKELWSQLLERPVFKSTEIKPKVQAILDAVQNNGDKALKEFTEKFDGLKLDSVKVTDAEFNEALEIIDDDLKAAINVAAINIEHFHSVQLPKVVRTETTKGVTCWQKAVPIQRVGLYIPGGTAPLFSSVLMLAIPARIAQCPEVVLCTPADKTGKVNPAILFVAKLTGVQCVYKIGGAQAIGAMAFGTESIKKVDKIFGPGNQYVTTAKQMVASKGIAIDMPAGPSEVMVVVDENTPAAFAASDLLSQAEHGIDSQVILLAPNKEKMAEIEAETIKQLALLPRRDIAQKALENSRFIVFSNTNDAVTFMNMYAPEHLILALDNPEDWANQVKQAGSVFLGNYTPESAGDYASGTNHTLPTNGYANAYSGVNMDSFMKKITFQQITPQGLQNIGPAIEIMAKAERLDAHKNAVTLRLKSLE